MKGYVKALRKGNGYQYICDNGYDMSKAELCDIIKEFEYILKKLSNQNVGSNAYLECVADSIEENCIID